MADVDFEDVKKLRLDTGAGVGLCKEALESSKGDRGKAIEFIRKKGALKAEKRSDKVAAEGIIGVYLHGVGKRVAALVELNCETDFVARTDAFSELAHELAMQVAAMSPAYVDRNAVPGDVLEKEREIAGGAEDLKGKPADVVDRIVEGKMEKYYSEHCLVDQPYFKNPEVTVQGLIDETVAALGEKIKVSQIYRMEVGG